MRGRDDNIALRALIAAVESNTELIKAMRSEIVGRFDAIDAHLDALIDTVADHIAHHGDDAA